VVKEGFMTVQLIAVEGVPLIKPGDDVAAILQTCLQEQGITFQNNDVLAIAQKIISKSEGCLVNLREVIPSERANAIAPLAQKDPRHIQVILDQSKEVIWVSPGIFVVETHHGFVCANAGVDRSNIEQPTHEEHDEWLALLPPDPNRSAATIRQRVQELSGADIAVVINDTHGRPFRMGGVGVAIGAAGLLSLVDKRGETDMFGYVLQATLVATGDEIAATASMIMGQAAERTPAVLIRGLHYRRPVAPTPDLGASDLVRPPDKDVFRYPANRKVY
jgi:coenzyme F420-0:L-glutamate ligase/coenzyme F420-1:gamma-L-glutamate ligase